MPGVLEVADDLRFPLGRQPDGARNERAENLWDDGVTREDLRGVAGGEELVDDPDRTFARLLPETGVTDRLTV